LQSGKALRGRYLDTNKQSKAALDLR